MIRINLMPFRAARKRENVRRQVSVFFLTLVLMFSLMAYLTFDLNRDLAAQLQMESERKKELTTLSAVAKRVDELKKTVDQIRSKQEVIKRLEKEKGGPVAMLRGVASAVPPDRLWLKSLTHSGTLLNLDGSAMDNDTVALFMTNLEAIPSMSVVDLKGTTLKSLDSYRVSVTDFAIICRGDRQEATKGPEKKPERRGR